MIEIRIVEILLVITIVGVALLISAVMNMYEEINAPVEKIDDLSEQLSAINNSKYDIQSRLSSQEEDLKSLSKCLVKESDSIDKFLKNLGDLTDIVNLMNDTQKKQYEELYNDIIQINLELVSVQDKINRISDAGYSNKLDPALDYALPPVITCDTTAIDGNSVRTQLDENIANSISVNQPKKRGRRPKREKKDAD